MVPDASHTTTGPTFGTLLRQFRTRVGLTRLALTEREGAESARDQRLGEEPEGDGAMDSPGIGPILDLLRRLRTIEGARESPQGLDVALSAEARWYDGNRDQLLVASLSVHGFYRKMPSHLARLALVLPGLWHPDDPTAPLSGETLKRAIALVEFYRVHVHRAITLIGEREPLR